MAEEKKAAKTYEMTLTCADNGMMVKTNGMTIAVENSHGGGGGLYDNIEGVFGKALHRQLQSFINTNLANAVGVRIELTKEG